MIVQAGLRSAVHLVSGVTLSYDKEGIVQVVYEHRICKKAEGLVPTRDVCWKLEFVDNHVMPLAQSRDGIFQLSQSVSRIVRVPRSSVTDHENVVQDDTELAETTDQLRQHTLRGLIIYRRAFDLLSHIILQKTQTIEVKVGQSDLDRTPQAKSHNSIAEDTAPP
jgi:hypothetical protein